MLFSSGKPLSIEFMQTLINIDKRKMKTALAALKDDYSRLGGAVYLVDEGDNHWKFAVKSAHTELVSKIVSDVELSLQTLKTLAVVAYKNPVLQADVVKVRGSNAYEHVSELEKLKFIRREKEGNSYRVYLTDKFIEYFDIEGGNVREIFHKMQEKRKQLLEEKRLKNPLYIEETEEVEEAPVITRSGEEIMADVDKKLEALGSRMDELDKEKEKHVSEMSELQEDDAVHTENEAEE